jgi:DNA polymerase III epsilon subunit-like protein
MAKKKFYMVLDTETANGLDDPLVYDIGFAIIDKKGQVYLEKSFVIYDTFVLMKDLMQTAYYAGKIPQYEEDLKNGKRKLVTLATAQSIIAYNLKKFNVSAVIAHNMRFDYNALNTTLRYLTKSQKRYFLPYNTTIWCSLAMARTTIGKQKTYRLWCKENGYVTRNNQPRLTAEILYRYITDNNDFIESHTGLEDVLIEKEIFAHCTRQHKKMQRTYWKETA